MHHDCDYSKKVMTTVAVVAVAKVAIMMTVERPTLLMRQTGAGTLQVCFESVVAVALKLKKAFAESARFVR